MERLLAVALAAFLVAWAPTASADWLQMGSNGSRDGLVPGQGPALDDVALQVPAPGRFGFRDSPLLIGRTLYYLACTDPCTDPGSGELDATDVDEGVTRRLATVEGIGPVGSFYLVSDGTVLAGLDERGVHGFDLLGKKLWNTSLPALAGTFRGRICLEPAVADATLYVVCRVSSYVGLSLEPPPDPVPAGATTTANVLSDLVVSALDMGTGRFLWNWTRGDAQRIANQGAQLKTQDLSFRSEMNGAAVLGDRFVISSIEESRQTPCLMGALPLGGCLPEAAPADGREDVRQNVLWGLDRADGHLAWSMPMPATPVLYDQRKGPTSLDGSTVGTAGQVSGNERIGLANLQDRIVTFNPSTGQETAPPQELLNADNVAWNYGVGMALNGSALYVRSFQNLYGFDLFTRAPLWEPFTLPALQQWSFSPPVVAGQRLYIMAVDQRTFPDGFSRHYLHCFDLSKGGRDLLWVHTIDASSEVNHWFTVAAGVVAIANRPNLIVLGVTGATPRLEATGIPQQVAPTDVIDIALSSVASNGTTEGEYRVQWGDGTTTNWTADSHVGHAYAAAGTYSARFQVRTASGQTGSLLHTFQVVPAGPALNPLQRAFATDNQNATFFVIGIVVTGLGALYGGYKVRRRRRLVKRELAAIDKRRRELEHDADAFHQFARDRQAAWHEFVLDHRLDEAQAAFLNHRLEELVRDSRLRVVDERLDFLPHGLVRRIRAIMADGFLSTSERDAFLAKLEAEHGMTRSQRGAVRMIIESWHGQDHRA